MTVPLPQQRISIVLVLVIVIVLGFGFDFGFGLARTAQAASPQTLILEQNLNSYSGCDDNSLYADRPDNSNGANATLFSGATIGSVRRALIRFDLSRLPAGSIILSAELRLTLAYSGLDAAEGDLYSLHRLTADWGEGTADSGDPGGLGAPANPGDATWTDNHFTQSQWTTPGGDYQTTPSATLPVNRWDSVAPANNDYTFAGPALAADASAWQSDPDANHGWILIGQENNSRNSRRFNSSESPNPRPRLTLTYDPPPTLPAQIQDYLLGRTSNPETLDTNNDGTVDVADLLKVIPWVYTVWGGWVVATARTRTLRPRMAVTVAIPSAPAYIFPEPRMFEIHVSSSKTSRSCRTKEGDGVSVESCPPGWCGQSVLLLRIWISPRGARCLD